MYKFLGTSPWVLNGDVPAGQRPRVKHLCVLASEHTTGARFTLAHSLHKAVVSTHYTPASLQALAILHPTGQTPPRAQSVTLEQSIHLQIDGLRLQLLSPPPCRAGGPTITSSHPPEGFPETPPASKEGSTHTGLPVTPHCHPAIYCPQGPGPPGR